MKRYAWLLIFSLLLSTVLIGCGNGNRTTGSKSSPQAQSTEIIVSAAASLTDSLTELQKEYIKKNQNVKITFNFGASGTLQKQIEQGAPADIFISAGKTQIDSLEQKNLLVKESVINLLGNDLVLVVNKENASVNSLQDLTKTSVQKISIGTPESVPAGKYAQEALITLNLWNMLQSKCVFAKDVTQVLNYVETGNVDAGLVYKSDAQGSTKVKIASVVPADAHKQIIYPAAIVAATKNKQSAEEFLSYLKSPEAQQIFIKYGFKILIK